MNYYYAKWTKSCDDVRWFPTTCMNGKGASLDRFGLCKLEKPRMVIQISDQIDQVKALNKGVQYISSFW